MLTSSQPRLLGGLDDLAIQALVAQPPIVRPSDGYLAFELVWDDESAEEVAVTNQFVRLSAPYERVELDLSPSMTPLRRARPTRFVTTVTARAPLQSPPPPSTTVSFDKIWFEQPDEDLAAIDNAGDVAVTRASSWLWLAISLLAAAVAVGYMQYQL